MFRDVSEHMPGFSLANEVRHVIRESFLNPICHMLALLGAHHILHVSRIEVTDCRSCTGLQSRVVGCLCATNLNGCELIGA